MFTVGPSSVFPDVLAASFQDSVFPDNDHKGLPDNRNKYRDEFLGRYQISDVSATGFQSYLGRVSKYSGLEEV